MGQNHPKRIPCEPTQLFPIKVLIEELDSEVFWQIHRGTVVNLRAIAKVIRETDGRPRIRLRDCPEILEVSRSYSGLFRGMKPQSTPIPIPIPPIPTTEPPPALTQYQPRRDRLKPKRDRPKPIRYRYYLIFITLGTGSFFNDLHSKGQAPF